MFSAISGTAKPVIEYKKIIEYHIDKDDKHENYSIYSDSSGHLYIKYKEGSDYKQLSSCVDPFLVSPGFQNSLTKYITRQMYTEYKILFIEYNNRYNFIPISIPLRDYSFSSSHYFTQYNNLFILKNNRDYYTSPVLMVIVPDLSQDSSIGIWSYILSIKTGLRFGSMYPYFERAHKKGYATVIINPNAKPETVLPFEHIKAVFKFLLKKTKCQSMLILACGESGSIVKDIIDDDLEFDLIPHISFIGFCNSSHLTTGEERIGTLELLSSRSHHWLSNTFLQRQRERIVGKFSSIPIDSALYIYITNLTNNLKNLNNNNNNNSYNIPTLCDSGYIAAIAIDSVFQMFNKSLEQPIQPPHFPDNNQNISLKDSIYACQRCGMSFSFMTTKHRCSICKKILCNDCSKYRIPLFYKDKCRRVCTSCYQQRNIIAKLGTEKISLSTLPIQKKSDSSLMESKSDENIVNYDGDDLITPSLPDIEKSTDYSSEYKMREYSIVLSQYQHISDYIIWFNNNNKGNINMKSGNSNNNSINNNPQNDYVQLTQAINQTITKLYELIRSKYGKSKTVLDWTCIYLLCMKFTTVPLLQKIHLIANKQYRDEDSMILSVKSFILQYKPILLAKILNINRKIHPSRVNWCSEIELINTVNDLSSLDYYILTLNKVVDNIINKMKMNKISSESLTIDTILPIFIYIVSLSSLRHTSLIFHLLWDLLSNEYKMSNLGYNVSILGSCIEGIKGLPEWYMRKCAIFIQKMWKGYYTRKLFKLFKKYGILSELSSWMDIRSYKEDYNLYSPILEANITFGYLINSAKTPEPVLPESVNNQLASLLI